MMLSSPVVSVIWILVGLFFFLALIFAIDDPASRQRKLNLKKRRRRARHRKRWNP